MILVGQYDSPFVRRVAVILNLYGFPFVRRPFSVFKDFDAVLALNPLGKVPVLTLDDGENLFDSRQRVTDATGATPISYQPDLLDPLGRSVRLSIRKLFF